jgi:hypothetical protein
MKYLPDRLCVDNSICRSVIMMRRIQQNIKIVFFRMISLIFLAIDNSARNGLSRWPHSVNFVNQ